VLDLLKKEDLNDVMVILGGTIPDEDAARLKQLGVAEVFQPGAALEYIARFIRENVHHREMSLDGH
jgi:methylmalonyl-CoA mutase C-terminal domain/subunit